MNMVNKQPKKAFKILPRNSKMFSYLKTLELVGSLYKHKEGKMHSQYYNLIKIQKKTCEITKT